MTTTGSASAMPCWHAVGLSNAEIADRLVASPKTVGTHVSAVLAELDVRRRAEVAAPMIELGAPI